MWQQEIVPQGPAHLKEAPAYENEYDMAAVLLTSR